MRTYLADTSFSCSYIESLESAKERAAKAAAGLDPKAIEAAEAATQDTPAAAAPIVAQSAPAVTRR